MGTRITERVVRAADVGSRKYVIFDEDCAGFGLCVYKSGRKGFVLIYRSPGGSAGSRSAPGRAGA